MIRHTMKPTLKIVVCIAIWLISPVLWAEVGPNWIEQWGIRWTFDKNISLNGANGTYRYGQFVNGDYWILGPVNIITINPPKTTITQDGKQFIVDGSMIDPSELSPGPSGASSKQGFDSRVPFWDPGLCLQAPIRLSGVQSLVSVRSWRLGENGCPARYFSTTGSTMYYTPRPTLRTAAVLTCVSSVPEEDAFRPAYCGSATKITHRASDMDLSILPALPAVTGIPNLNDPAVWSTWSDYLRKPWFDFPTTWDAEPLHPSDSMPNYGRDLTARINDVALLMMLNSNWITSAQKRTLATQMTQLGIDFYGIIANGGGWGHIGGGIGQGRKLPILFAGMALDYFPYKNIGMTHGYDSVASRNHLYFQEDAQKFYTTQADIDRYGTEDKRATRTNCRVDASDPTVIIDDSGKDWFIADDGESEIKARELKTNFDYWLVWNYGSANEEFVRILGVNDQGIGNNKMKLRDPVTPGTRKTARVQLYPQGRLGMPDWASQQHCISPENDWYSRDYRLGCSGNSLAGAQLLALAVKTRDGNQSMKDLWNWPAFFDYMDYYMQETHTDAWKRQKSTFAANMWDAYRSSYGPLWKAETSANSFTLTATCKNGRIIISPRKDRYARGETVTVSVTPSLGYSFVAWDGDIQSTANPLILSMDGHKAIAAITTKTTPIAWIRDSIQFTSVNQSRFVSLYDANVRTGTVLMRVKPDNIIGRKLIFGHTLGTWSNRIRLYLNNEQLCIALGDSGATKTNIEALQPNKTYNLALVWDNGDFRVYVNGQPKASGTYTGLTYLYTYAEIGNIGNPADHTSGFAGTITDVRIYNRALSQDEINQTLVSLELPENWLLNETLIPNDLSGNPVSFSPTVAGLPKRASFDPATKTLSWRPWYDQAGNYDLIFSAVGNDYTQKVTIDVEDVLLKTWYQDWLNCAPVQSAMVEY